VRRDLTKAGGASLLAPWASWQRVAPWAELFLALVCCLLLQTANKFEVLQAVVSLLPCF